MKEELLQGLSEEQVAKIKQCKNQKELLDLAKKEGIQLNDEQLASISGGACTTKKCPNCGSEDIRKITNYAGPGGGAEVTYYQCNKCGHKWS